MAARRQRIDSVDEAVRVARGASLEIVPAEHHGLTEQDMPYWDNVIAMKAKADWDAHDLDFAAKLAKCMADETRNYDLLRSEGEVVLTANGTPTPNPRLAALRMYQTNAAAIRKTLALHARGREGDNRVAATRRAGGRAIEAGLSLDDDFIGRPVSH